MNTAITFTMSQLLTFCGGIITLSGAVAVIAKVIGMVLTPNKEQDERIKALEETSEKTEERLDAMEKSNNINHRALLALLKHGIDGNAVEAMKSAEDEITKYLIER